MCGIHDHADHQETQNHKHGHCGHCDNVDPTLEQFTSRRDESDRDIGAREPLEQPSADRLQRTS